MKELGRQVKSTPFSSHASLLATLGTCGGFGLIGAFDQQSVHAQVTENDGLLWDELSVIAQVFNIPLPDPNTRDETQREMFSHQCFSLVFTDCQQNKWERIDRIQEVNKTLLSRLKDQAGRSLLIAAVDGGEDTCIQKLLERDIALSARDAQGNNPLHIAAKRGSSTSLMKLLVPKCREYREEVNHKKQRPIHLSVKRGHEHCVRLLVQEGVDTQATVTWKEDVQLSPAALAIATGHTRCLYPLIQASTWADQTVGIGNLAHVAVRFQQTRCLERLLRGDHGSEVQKLLTQADDQGRFPISLACYYGDVQAVLLLLPFHPGTVIRDRSGKTIVHWAVAGKQHEVLQALSLSGIDLKAPDGEDQAPLPQIKADLSEAANETRKVYRKLTTPPKKKESQTQDKKDRRVVDLLPPENLVFSGGGPKCIIEIGGLKALKKQGLLEHVRRDCGTSGGALVAALHGAGHEPESMQNTMKNLNLIDLFDPLPEYKTLFHSTLELAMKEQPGTMDALTLLKDQMIEEMWRQGGPVAGAKAVIDKCCRFHGFCKGDDYRQWIDDQIKETTKIENCTFKELRELVEKDPKKYHHLHIYASRLAGGVRQETVCFNSEDSDFDDLIISDVVRASGGLPAIFIPHVIHKKDENGQRVPWKANERWVDGGIHKNFPIDQFDQNKYQRVEGAPDCETTNRKTMGFRIVSPDADQAPSPTEITTVKELLSAIVQFYWQAEDIILLNKKCHRARTVNLRVLPGVTTLNMNLTPEEKMALVAEGERCTLASDPFRYAKRHRLKLAPPTLFSKKPTTRWMKSFVGRQKEQDQLRDALPKSPHDETQVRLIYGLPGAGKSSLVWKFTENCYPHRIAKPFVINCRNEVTRAASYDYIAAELGIGSRDKEELPEELRERVHQVIVKKGIKKQRFDKPWVFILDNLETVPEAGVDYPTKGGLVIVTSRKADTWSEPNERAELKMFDEDESVALLKNQIYGNKACGQQEMQEMKLLAEDLGHYPLGLFQVGRDIRYTGQSIADYRHDFNVRKAVLSAQAQPSDWYKHTMRSVWETTLTSMANQHLDAFTWLSICAHFDADAIPTSWLNDWVGVFTDGISVTGAEAIERHLVDRALIQINADGSAFSMHDILQDVVQALEPIMETSEATPIYISSGIAWQFLVWQDRQLAEQYDSMFAEQFLQPHYASVSNGVVEWCKQCSDWELLADVCFKLSRVYFSGRHLPLALTYSGFAIDFRKAVHEGEDHDEIIDALWIAAEIRSSCGDKELQQEGLKYSTEALEMCHRLYGNEDQIDTANALLVLEQCQLKLRIDSGFNTLVEGCEMRSRVSPDSLPTAGAMNSVGVAAIRKKDYALAAIYLERSIRAWEQSGQSQRSPMLALTLTRLSNCLVKQQHKLKEAVRHADRAVAILQDCYDEKNVPRLVSAQMAKAAALSADGQSEDALVFANKALDTAEQLQHSKLIILAHMNVAAVLLEDRKHDLAQDHVDQAIGMLQQHGVSQSDDLMRRAKAIAAEIEQKRPHWWQPAYWR